MTRARSVMMTPPAISASSFGGTRSIRAGVSTTSTTTGRPQPPPRWRPCVHGDRDRSPRRPSARSRRRRRRRASRRSSVERSAIVRPRLAEVSAAYPKSPASVTVTAVVRTSRRMISSAESREILDERGGFALAQLHGDAELFEVLLERLVAELGPAGFEKGVHVALQLGRGETDDALGQAPEPVLRVLPLHRVPVRLDELPGELAPVDGHQHRPHHERRVLGPELTVDRACQRLREQLALPDGGPSVEVPLLFLRRGRRP